MIGHPIAHSRSPLIHNFWIKQLGLDATYEAIDISTQNLQQFSDRIKTGEFIGGNVTIPHKQNIMTYCDDISASARTIGAVNTLSFENARLKGSNTDHFGFVDNLDQQAPGWAHSLATAIVLGAGGAARAVVHALLQRGTGRVVVLNRTTEKAKQLALSFGERVVWGSLKDFNAYSGAARLLVNCSAVGLNGTKFDNLDLSTLPKSALVNDIVYSPLKTPFLATAAEAGLRTVDGLGMLLHQAIPGFEKWFGIRPEVTPDLRELVERTIAPASKAGQA